MIFDIVQNVEK